MLIQDLCSDQVINIHQQSLGILIMHSPETQKTIRHEFARRFIRIQSLIAEGRSIEILIRILDQTRVGLAAVNSFESMMSSNLQIPSRHPKQSMSELLPGDPERAQVELARDIADKVAHGLFWQARELINKYAQRYPLKPKLTSDSMKGWAVEAKGMLIDQDGQRLEAIRDVLSTSEQNLIVEEFDLFVHNGYFDAARQIFRDAMVLLGKRQPSLAMDSARLHMFRGLKRGSRVYLAPEGEEKQ